MLLRYECSLEGNTKSPLGTSAAQANTEPFQLETAGQAGRCSETPLGKTDDEDAENQLAMRILRP